MVDPVKPFALRRKRLQRARIARGFADAAFLHARAAEDAADRLEAVNRRFGRALIIGDGGLFDSVLAKRPALAAKIDTLVRMDTTPALAVGKLAFVGDPEALPLAPASFDLVVSLLSLHWVNDLPGALIQIRRTLRPDGLFIGALLGGGTLQELRIALIDAETELRGGAGPRVSPFADALDMAGLLQRAGFTLPVSDVDRVDVRYKTPVALLADLRAMGEAAAFADPAPPLRRDVLMRAMALYQERHALPDGRVSARFDLVTATGWAPHESQQIPLKPGSAKARLADALGAKEISTGEKAGGG